MACTNEKTVKIHKPSINEMLFFFIAGIVLGFPAALVFETLTSDVCVVMPALVASCTVLLVVILGPIIEEFAKIFPLFYRHCETERSLVTLGFLIGLGFGLAEFVEYVFIAHVPFYLRIPQVFLHGSLTSIVAYGVAKKRTGVFYLIAVGLHMLVNFASFLPVIAFVVISALAYATAYLLAWRLHSDTAERFAE